MIDGNADKWVSPTAKSAFEVLESSPERLRLAFHDEPGNVGPPEHRHPEQEEEFTVIEGELTVRVDGQEHRLRAGDRLLVQKGQAHTFWNPASAPVRFVSEHRPALRFEAFIKTVYDLDRDGLSDAKGSPRALQLMVMLKSRGGEEYLAGPPQVAQRIAAYVLGTIGGWLGYKPVYVSKARRSVAAS